MENPLLSLCTETEHLDYHDRMKAAYSFGRDKAKHPDLSKWVEELRSVRNCPDVTDLQHPAPEIPKVEVEDGFTELLPSQVLYQTPGAGTLTLFSEGQCRQVLF